MSELSERRLARDERLMRHALALAAKAQALGEVPVGALVVHAEQIIGEGFNRSYIDHDPSAHAEIIALREAGLKRRSPRLTDCTLYVTLEPCAMCVGAMLHARLARLVFAAFDPKAGACGTAFDVLRDASYNHRIELTTGVLETQANQLLKDFFANLR